MDTSSASNTSPITLEFCKKLPKVELHAHLHGSIRKSTLIEYLKAKDINISEIELSTKDMNEAFKIFNYIHTAVENIEQVKRITREVLEDFAADNTVYLELRTTPRPLVNTTSEDNVREIIEEIKRYEEKNPDGMKTKLLLSIDRSQDVNKARETLELAKKYSATGYVIGLDYSGNPYKNSYSDHKEVFEEARKSGLKCTIHCGELPDEKNMKEVQEVLDSKPDRVGHFNYFDESLFKQIHDLNIPIEMCPTSNKFTMMLKDYKDHHFIKYLKTGHPLALCTDDTAVFDTTLSEEYLRIFEAFDIDVKTAKEIVRRSYECVFDEKMKEKLRVLDI